MNLISIIKRKIERNVAKRGIIGTVHLVWAIILRRFKDLTPSRRKSINLWKESDKDFDRIFGVDTSGIIKLSNLHLKSENWIYGIEYKAINDVNFNRVLSEFNLTYEEFTFIDFGSGKGRALLLASFFPFKKIIGVEFSEELTTIAKENILRFPDKQMKCKNIEALCMDATEYTLPDEKLVLYFYNPFQQPIMAQVADNVTKSFQLQPRPIVILYFKPDHREVWESIKYFKNMKSTPEYCAYISDLNSIQTEL